MIRENIYVRVHGHVRAFAGKRSVVAFRVAPIADMNELTTHMLEVIYAHAYLVQRGTSMVQFASSLVVCHVSSRCCWHCFIKGRLFSKAGLKCPSIRTYVGLLAYVCPSVHKTFLWYSEIWHVGRGRWLMHDGMQYDLMESQGQEPFKVCNPAIFKSCLLCHLQWELATDHGFLN